MTLSFFDLLGGVCYALSVGLVAGVVTLEVYAVVTEHFAPRWGRFFVTLFSDHQHAPHLKRAPSEAQASCNHEDT